jgi:hypothetical protein
MWSGYDSPSYRDDYSTVPPAMAHSAVRGSSPVANWDQPHAQHGGSRARAVEAMLASSMRHQRTLEGLLVRRVLEIEKYAHDLSARTVGSPPAGSPRHLRLSSTSDLLTPPTAQHMASGERNHSDRPEHTGPVYADEAPCAQAAHVSRPALSWAHSKGRDPAAPQRDGVPTVTLQQVAVDAEQRLAAAEARAAASEHALAEARSTLGSVAAAVAAHRRSKAQCSAPEAGWWAQRRMEETNTSRDWSRRRPCAVLCVHRRQRSQRGRRLSALGGRGSCKH